MIVPVRNVDSLGLLFLLAAANKTVVVKLFSSNISILFEFMKTEEQTCSVTKRGLGMKLANYY
jgi:hypothetical protein